MMRIVTRLWLERGGPTCRVEGNVVKRIYGNEL